jgi:hypothetical protein
MLLRGDEFCVRTAIELKFVGEEGVELGFERTICRVHFPTPASKVIMSL